MTESGTNTLPPPQMGGEQCGIRELLRNPRNTKHSFSQTHVHESTKLSSYVSLQVKAKHLQ